LAVKHFLGVYGHVNLDYILDVAHLPRPNTSIQIERERVHFGGTGGNVARLAATMGVSTALASFVGEDFPEAYDLALRESGVDMTDVMRIADYGTPRVWIFSDPHGNQMAVVDQGPMRIAGKLPLLTRTATGAEWVHFCTGRPEYYVKVAREAARAGKKMSLDPAQEIHYVYTVSTLRRIIGHADLFFGNEKEVARAAKMLRVAGARGLLRHVTAVLETRGAKGSLVHERDGTTEIPAIKPRKLVDYTGAGDAFRAGFYAGLSRGHDIVVCAILGSSASSFALEAKGTQTVLPTYPQILARAKKSGAF
jgi:sugar/nucleoside kinase (ribokinase family)